jgi:hypothetical protein
MSQKEKIILNGKLMGMLRVIKPKQFKFIVKDNQGKY